MNCKYCKKEQNSKPVRHILDYIYTVTISRKPYPDFFVVLRKPKGASFFTRWEEVGRVFYSPRDYTDNSVKEAQKMIPDGAEFIEWGKMPWRLMW